MSSYRGGAGASSYGNPGASTVALGSGYAAPHQSLAQQQSQQAPSFNYTNESYMFNRDSGSGEFFFKSLFLSF